MKTQSLVLTALLFSIGAFASSPAPIYYSQLSDVRADGQPVAFGGSGELQINELDHTVTLTLRTGTPPCPPMERCSLGMGMPVLVLAQTTLPILDVARNPNGDRVITAGRDLRRADGALQKLVILDNSSSPATGEHRILKIRGRYLSQSIARGQARVITQRLEFEGTVPRMIYPTR